MHPTKDAELVFRCLEGDTEAFAALVQRYQGAVYATAHYYAGRYGATEDIVQESFWAAYRSLPHLKEAEKFGAWLKEITTRTAANLILIALQYVERAATHSANAQQAYLDRFHMRNFQSVKGAARARCPSM